MILSAGVVFAQSKVVSEKKLVQTLEKNKKADVVFVSEISLDGFSVASDDSVSLPLFSGSAIKLVSGMDMTNISERLAYKKGKHKVTFTVKDASSKTYAITAIDGIESVSEYTTRLENERIAAEKRAKEQRQANLTRLAIQVVLPELENVTGSEKNWIAGQIQDKLKSNMQEYLSMKTLVDAKSEAAIVKAQKESESSARDEASAIELGKITTAKFALFSKIRKTGKGYIITADFTDLTTGEQMASATSKEYSEVEYLYGSTGAVDELTIAIADKLQLPLSAINRSVLSSGSSGFSVDEQLALAKENEEKFKKMMAQYDSDLARLSVSNDISSVENKKKIEAEKALLAEKQKSEQKRQQELAEQKKRADADAKLEAERSIALKTQRDKMAKDAAAKAAEVRKMKIAKQGVLGQINIIESKKKALVEIRNSVEARSQELFAQLEKERKSEEQRIRNKSYSTVEMENGKPTQAAKERREKQVIKSYEDLTNKFFADCDAVAQSTMSQQNALLTEIRNDQKTLTTKRTVSSMGEELKVSFGSYEGSMNGWNTYLSLYSDGVLLYTDSFIVGYEALNGKKAPDMAAELDDNVIEEYTNNVDMYNSLLTRGDPIIYFELDYTANAEDDDKPSEYKFNFNKIRVINTVSEKTVQTSTLSKVLPRTMKPAQDLRELVGIKIKEQARFDPQKYAVEVYMVKGKLRAEAAKLAAWDIKWANFFGSSKMIASPYGDYEMLSTKVTQETYTTVMGENPSKTKSKYYYLPVTNVSWYDAIYFCNKLSKEFGLTPVYAVGGNTDVASWGYRVHNGDGIYSDITWNTKADGFRLPTEDEMEVAKSTGYYIRDLAELMWGRRCYDWNHFEWSYIYHADCGYDNVGFRVVRTISK
ncbi:SUMF1/EgtB/PvdO family nonheme iron enzyme [Treponema saccharophilum]